MKELEIEYKKQIELELPDLWSRIESGVDAYEALKNNDINKETTKVVEFANIDSKKEILVETKQEEATNKIVELDGGSTTKKSNKRVIATVMKIVAAAASLFLVVNAIALFGGVKSNNSAPAAAESFAPMADAAATADEAACETAAPEMNAEESWESEAAVESVTEEAESTTEHIYDRNEGLVTGLSVNKESIRGEKDSADIKSDNATAGESAAQTELNVEEIALSEEAMQLLVERIGCSEEEAGEIALILQSIGVVEILDILPYEECEYIVYTIDNDDTEKVYMMCTETVDGKMVVSYISKEY